jgi:putative transposase
MEKRAMIEPEHPQISVARQCEMLDLPRSGYYRPEREESAETRKIMRLIDEEYIAHPTYGSRKIRDRLRLRGYKINRKRVQRLMRIMGIESLAPWKKTTIADRQHKKYPYLLRGMKINQPNHVWCSDITYVPMAKGHVYLTAVMDWGTRYVLSWELSVTLDDGFCVSALGRALRNHEKPEIFNTDQGAQYTGNEFTGILKDHFIKISMDGKGRATDNIMIERLWRTLKYDDIYIKDYQSVEQLIQGLRKFFRHYNEERPHDSLGGRTPAQAYWGSDALRMAA